MYHAVINYGNANPAIVATVPAFSTTFTSFKAKVSSIESTAQLETQVITGVATDKKTRKETLVQQATDIAAVVFSYASSVGNNTLKQQVNFSRSELLRLKDDELPATSHNIHDAANANLVALAPYGITAAMLTSFDTLISQYAAVVPSPRNAKAQRIWASACFRMAWRRVAGPRHPSAEPGSSASSRFVRHGGGGKLPCVFLPPV